jgi:uncharacterized protein
VAAIPLDAPGALRQTSATHITREKSRLAKILLIVLGLLIAYWILKRYKRKVEHRADEPPAIGEDMVRCAQCGVHLPRSESLTSEKSFYCSADHRRTHQGTD